YFQQMFILLQISKLRKYTVQKQKEYCCCLHVIWEIVITALSRGLLFTGCPANCPAKSVQMVAAP
ncbi:hypothetical protein NDU88_011761, partial [Pleurodeles waltl]